MNNLNLDELLGPSAPPIDQASPTVTLKDGRGFAIPFQGEVFQRMSELHPEKNSDYPWSDLGMAELFSDLGYNRVVRYCPDFGRWMVYENGVWKRDDRDALLTMGFVKDFQRLLALYASQLDNDESHMKFTVFVSRLGDNRARKRILDDARDTMRIEASAFDANPYLINCQNGTFNLKNGKFYPHKAEDFLTLQTDFEYTDTPNDFPRWNQFIDEIMESDTEKAGYLQKALGYSILGKASEDCMFVEYGPQTRNGKSVLNESIRLALGDYATVSPIEKLCEHGSINPESPSPELAKLKGKRFVTLSEPKRSITLDASIVKRLTGGEAISARELRKDPFLFVPQLTMWMSCNDLPRVNDKSLFTSNRLRVIQFNRHFDETEQDKSLKDQFRSMEARQGIFKWLVEGYKRYHFEGLIMPDKMKTVVRQYQDSNDTVLQFIQAQCEQVEGETERRSELYRQFQSWARTEGFEKLTKSVFFNELESHGFEIRLLQGTYVVNGLKLITHTVQL